MKISCADFDAQVLKSPMSVLVKFYSDGCGACRTVKPVVDELAIDLLGKVKVIDINVDDCVELAQKYSIRAIPAFKFFKGGKIIAESVGAQSKAQLMRMCSIL